MKHKLFIPLLLLFVLFIPFTSNALENLPHNSKGWYGGPVTSPFGYRVHPIWGTTIFHEGIDLGLPEGTPAPAAADGEITHSGWMGGYGYTVQIRMANGQTLRYGHMSEVYTYVGQKVKKGDVVGLVGSTGNSTGPHLHIELRNDYDVLDPEAFYIAAGWTFDGTASTHDPRPVKGQDFKNKSIDMKAFFNTTIDLTSHITTIIKAIVKAIRLVNSYVLQLLISLIILDLLFRYGLAVWQKRKESFLADFTEKIAKYTFFSMVIISWKYISELFKITAFDVADTTYKGTHTTEYIMSDPSLFLQSIGHLLTKFYTSSVFDIITTNPYAKAALEGISAISPIYEMYYSMIHFFFIILILSTLFIMCYVSWTIVYFYLTSFCCLLGIPFAAFSITRQPTVMMYKSFGLQILHLIVIGMICNFVYTTITTTAESDFGLSELIYTTVNVLLMAYLLPKMTKHMNAALAG